MTRGLRCRTLTAVAWAALCPALWAGYTDPGKRFSIEPPRGWDAQAADGSGRVTFVAPGRAASLSVLAVQVEQGASLEVLAAACSQVTTLWRSPASLTLLAETRTTLAGQPALRREYRVDARGREPHRLASTYLKTGRLFLAITATAPERELRWLEPAFRHCLSSLRLLPASQPTEAEVVRSKLAVLEQALGMDLVTRVHYERKKAELDARLLALAPAPTPALDPATRRKLEALDAAYQMGVITDEEYARKRAELLAARPDIHWDVVGHPQGPVALLVAFFTEVNGGNVEAAVQRYTSGPRGPLAEAAAGVRGLFPAGQIASVRPRVGGRPMVRATVHTVVALRSGESYEGAVSTRRSHGGQWRIDVDTVAVAGNWKADPRSIVLAYAAAAGADAEATRARCRARAPEAADTALQMLGDRNPTIRAACIDLVAATCTPGQQLVLPAGHRPKRYDSDHVKQRIRRVLADAREPTLVRVAAARYAAVASDADALGDLAAACDERADAALRGLAQEILLSFARTRPEFRETEARPLCRHTRAFWECFAAAQAARRMGEAERRRLRPRTWEIGPSQWGALATRPRGHHGRPQFDTGIRLRRGDVVYPLGAPYASRIAPTISDGTRELALTDAGVPIHRDCTLVVTGSGRDFGPSVRFLCIRIGRLGRPPPPPYPGHKPLTKEQLKRRRRYELLLGALEEVEKMARENPNSTVDQIARLGRILIDFGRDKQDLLPAEGAQALRDIEQRIARLQQQLLGVGAPPSGVYLGIEAEQVTPLIARRLGVGAAQGIAITKVHAGSPASAAGLKANDVVFWLDRPGVHSLGGIRAVLATKKPGDAVGLLILRGGRAMQKTVKLGQRRAGHTAAL